MEMCLMRRRASSLGAAARPIVSKLDSYGLRPESKAASAEGDGGCESASAEGVGAWLARDLARSGSKPC